MMTIKVIILWASPTPLIDKDEWAAAMSPVYKEFEKLIGADIIEKVREK